MEASSLVSRGSSLVLPMTNGSWRLVRSSIRNPSSQGAPIWGRPGAPGNPFRKMCRQTHWQQDGIWWAGKSWSKDVTVDPDQLGTGGKSYPVLTESKDGLLAFFTEGRGGDARFKPMMGGPQTIFRKSEDGGATWGQRHPINVFTDPHSGR